MEKAREGKETKGGERERGMEIRGKFASLAYWLLGGLTPLSKSHTGMRVAGMIFSVQQHICYSALYAINEDEHRVLGSVDTQYLW